MNLLTCFACLGGAAWLIASAGAPAPPPFELVLEVAASSKGAAGPQLVVRLRNVSGQPQTYLVDVAWQPVLLLIRDEQGHLLKPFDERSTQKFGFRVHRASYRLLPAAGQAELLSVPFKPTTAGAYAVQWESFRMLEALSPGRYRVQAEWQSAINRYVLDNGKMSQLPGLWLGQVRSQEVLLTLPAR